MMALCAKHIDNLELTDLGDQMPDFYFTVGALLTSMLGICLPRSAFDAIGAAMTALVRLAEGEVLQRKVGERAIRECRRSS